MNAPIGTLVTSRQRTAQELADSALAWHADAIDAATRPGGGPEDFERVGLAALLSAERMAEEAREEADAPTRAMFLCVAGRYALKARVCLQRARELRA